MMTLTAADVEVGSAPKRGCIVPDKGTVLYKYCDVPHRLLYEYTQTSPTTKEVVVVKSKVDLLTRVLLW